MELFEAFEKRHSYRSFREDPIPREVLARLVKAAGLAPSSHNEQPWRFVIASGEVRTRVAGVMSQGTHYVEEYIRLRGEEVTDEIINWYSDLGGAPVIVVCLMPQSEGELERLNVRLALGAAVQNMQLAATAEGLGACMVTASFWVRDEFSSVLDVPDGWTVGALVALGYPTDEPPHAPSHDADIAIYRE